VRRLLLLAVVLAGCKPKAAPDPESQRPGNGSLVASTHGGALPVNQDTAAAGAASTPPPDAREKALGNVIVQLLEGEHLLQKKIDDDVSKVAFKSYLDGLDPGKMFLVKADRDALSVHTTTIDDELKSGDLALAHEGSKLFVTRVGVVAKMVESILAAPLDLTNDETVEIDPDKLDLAADDAELKDRWRKRLELEVLERIASMEARLEADAKSKEKDKKDGAKKDAKSSTVVAPDDEEDKSAPPVAQIPTTPEGREAKAREDLAKTYSSRFVRMEKPGPLDAASELVNAVTAALDPHTNYLPPADKANFDIRMSGALEGIGAVLREKDHLIEIVEIVPGGASWRHGGLQQGDLIMSVQQEKKDPVDVFDMRIDEVVKMVRGPKGTVVRLRIQKQSGTIETVAITRDVVVIEDSYAKAALVQQKGKPVMGYIHLPSFYGGSGSPRQAGDDLKTLFAEMKQKKVAGVVLDIRSNGGGLLADAIEISGHLIDRGPVVQVKDSDGQREVLSDTKKGIVYDGPVIVLVDQFSASASEILAGALQDYGRALIVGNTTHGKGTVQTIADLDRLTGNKVELGVLKITIQQFFRPSGSSVQREGVTPDIALPNPNAHIDSGERELPQAIAWSKITPAPFDKWGFPWNKKALADKSAARVAKDPVLTKVAAATALLRARRNDTKIPLAKPAWEARRKEQKAALEAASPDLKKVAPQFTVKPMAESPAPATAPGPGGKQDDSEVKWRDNLAKDAWVAETLSILGDMTSTKALPTH
jgi:carboxyl-terminal processing protease